MPVRMPFTAGEAHYRVSTTLDGREYILDVNWNGYEGAWYFDLLLDDETPIATGLKIVLGRQIGDRVRHDARPPGIIMASDLSGDGREAGYDDIGVRVNVYYFPASEVGRV